MDDDNLFHEDDALDCMVFDELNKENNTSPKGGCFSVIIILIIPATVLFSILSY